MSIKENREKYINKILRWHPDYLVEKFESMSDNQLYAVYKDLQRKREELEKEVYALIETQSLSEKLPLSVVHTSSSNQLKAILNNSRVYIPNKMEFKMPEYLDDVEFLSPEELYQILGEDPSDYAPQSLLEKGYFVEPGASLNHRFYEEKKQKEADLKKEIIHLLSHSAKITGFDNSKENLKRLRNCSLEQLKYLYEEYQETLKSLPTLEEISLKLANKHQM